jgi:hypothetical protein
MLRRRRVGEMASGNLQRKTDMLESRNCPKYVLRRHLGGKDKTVRRETGNEAIQRIRKSSLVVLGKPLWKLSRRAEFTTWQIM